MATATLTQGRYRVNGPRREAGWILRAAEARDARDRAIQDAETLYDVLADLLAWQFPEWRDRADALWDFLLSPYDYGPSPERIRRMAEDRVDDARLAADRRWTGGSTPF